MDLLRQKYAGLLDLSLLDQPQTDKTMVYSCRSWCNGWGDRIRGIMSVYILALLTRRRFMIDMNIPCPLARFLKPNIVNWTFTDSKLPSGKKRTRLVIADMLPNNKGNDRLISIISSKDFVSEWESYDDVWITTHGYFVTRALRNPLVNSSWLIGQLPLTMATDKTLFALFFELLFMPTKTLVQSVDRILRLPYDRLVCLHIRKGRNPSNPIDAGFPLRKNITKTMIAFLDKMTGNVTGKVTQIFVTSDSDAAIKEVGQHFLGSVVTVPGPILHIDQVHHSSRRSLDKRSICEGFLKVLTEFLVLGECDVSILSRSGFSVWASRRRVKSNEPVYLHEDSNQSIIRVKV